MRGVNLHATVSVTMSSVLPGAAIFQRSEVTSSWPTVGALGLHYLLLFRFYCGVRGYSHLAPRWRSVFTTASYCVPGTLQQWLACIHVALSASFTAVCVVSRRSLATVCVSSSFVWSLLPPPTLLVSGQASHTCWFILGQVFCIISAFHPHTVLCWEAVFAQARGQCSSVFLTGYQMGLDCFLLSLRLSLVWGLLAVLLSMAGLYPHNILTERTITPVLLNISHDMLYTKHLKLA